VRLIFAGTPAVASTSLEAIVHSRHEVVAVVTRPDTRRGRGQNVGGSPVSQRADELGLPQLKPDSLREPAFAEALAAYDVDCCAVVAFGGLVPTSLLEVPTRGWVNLHFSLLPAWRGAAPVQHAILHGDEITGATTFRLTEGLDTGPVFGSVTEPVLHDDTSGTLLDRLSRSGAELLVHTLDRIADGSAVAVEQSDSGASAAGKLTRDDARIRWTDPALAIDRRIRACTPSPGAWTEYDGQQLGLMPISLMSNAPNPRDAAATLAPGQIRVAKNEVWVGSGSHDVRLGEVKPSGRRVMDAAAWARGAHLSDGDILT
jgi:methionyl-tRNA formyltransferase